MHATENVMRRQFLNIVTLILVLLCSQIQVYSTPQSLREQIDEGYALLNHDPEAAFEIAQTVEQNALETDEKEAEMWALITLCVYYQKKIDFENLVTTANRMYDRAVSTKMPKYQAIAKYYLFESYLFNKLPEKAISHLNEGMQVVNRINDTEVNSLSSIRMNYYVAYSNYYLEIKDYENQLKYIILSGKEIDNMPEGNGKEVNRYINISNMAQVYREMGQLDSAKFYVTLSEKSDEQFQVRSAKFMNMLILAEIALEESNYNEALQRLKQAEDIEQNINHINRQKLYDLFSDLYFETNDRENYNKYQSKKEALELNITHNQNKFLLTLLQILEKPTDRKYILPFIMVIALLTVYIAIVMRKNKTLQLQEATSKAYLQNTPIAGHDHHRLIELLKENNASYMAYFTEVYPDFEAQLTDLSSKITTADVEFCSFLKLKLSTKEIAQYSFIAPKTVRNKKYIIRKKLNIPTEIDIYEFFDNF